MAGTVRKLVVEVVEARDLLPKDGAGSSSPYAVVDFDGQRRRTSTAHRTLNPTWNDTLTFDLVTAGDGEPMEVDVLHDRRVGPSRRSNFLGRVRLDSGQFVRKGEEALIHFPLQRKTFFSWVRGDLGLRVYFSDEPAPAPTLPSPPDAPADEPAEAPTATEAEKPDETAPPPAEAEKSPEAAAAAPAPEETTPAAPPPAADPPAESPPAAAGDQQEPPPAQEDAPNAENPPEDSAAGSVPPAPEKNTLPVGPEAPTPPPPPEPEKEMAAGAPQPQPRPMPPPITPVPSTAGNAGVPERSSLDLVEKMQYLFVRVVRARSLPAGAGSPHVRVAVSGRRAGTGPPARTTSSHHTVSFEWEQTFAFPREASSSSAASDQSPLEISVWDLPPGTTAVDENDDDVPAGRSFLGGVCFDVSEVPIRDPPDSPLATQWYRLEGAGTGGGDLMLATWVGTQADESFHGAWKADAPRSRAAGASRSKVYVSPKLWYLRLTVLESQDLLPLSLPLPLIGSTVPISVRATLGSQSLRTRPASLHRNGSPVPPTWNEDLLFVAAEPFGDQALHLAVELRPGKEPPAVLGLAGLPLSSVERRVDDRRVAPRWLDLLLPPPAKKGAAAEPASPRHRGRLQVRVCLDGGYHVADEPAHACSDYRPSARQLWRPPVGTVELGIIGCRNLLPARTLAAVSSAGGLRAAATADAYAVAKYGPKWARTRTVAGSLDPTWNEQYTWAVHDPCTVLTVAVFDESSSPVGAGEDDHHPSSPCRPVGRVRIRVSALESGRAYRVSYPLHLLLPTGAHRTGELDLAVRFARAGSPLDLLHVYGRPLLPAMHHIRPIAGPQREPLRLSSARLVAAHLARSEPSMRKEAVMYVLEAEHGTTGFSIRRVRANWNRTTSSLAWVARVARWAEDTRSWRNPTATILAHAVLVLLVWHPDLVVPAAGIHVALLGVWKYRKRPRGAAQTGHVCLKSSQLDPTAPGATQLAEELDEEFDPVPSIRGAEVARARYDRLRTTTARVQGMLGDVAAQGERLQGLVTWRDPCATGIFVVACMVISIVLLVVPIKMAIVAAGFYWLRHPMFRDRTPPRALNFFRRLPTLSDRIM